jgi:hypothetical protein
VVATFSVRYWSFWGVYDVGGRVWLWLLAIVIDLGERFSMTGLDECFW